ncbi:exodeoxyribonuclease I [Candidatus Saccharibacteria bacterium]|nr:exodeoxyribonuclease I [Candidatus Saccharibacteria bacterium]
MNKSFFFYDLETSGLSPREDRIMQFAGQRTTLDLELIGEPVNILVKITDDALPSPGAIMVTGITPQQTLQDGITEAEFAKYITEEIFVPNTIALGFNTVRFDDEFIRATLWRNFYDPYEWQWKDGRSRWDILDVVRLTRALRPEGINWPFTDDGRPTNRLELITKLNGVSHEHAHDALSDVYATIAVAKLIKSKQPKLFDYLFKMRDKNAVKKLVNLEDKKPFVYASGRYSNDFNKTTVAFPLTSSKNGNVLVYDLRYDLEEVSRTAHSETFYPIVKELCYNKCPAVAPISVLDEQDGWAKIGLDSKTIDQNLVTLLKHPEFAEQMREANESRPDFPPAIEPEAAIYEGFLNDSDRIKVAAVRDADQNRLADLHPEFIDEHLPELLLHYKGRNFKESLSEAEAKAYEEYRQKRLERQAPKFIKELEEAYKKDDFLAEELKLYFESLMV